jgi:hypothetical protein
MRICSLLNTLLIVAINAFVAEPDHPDGSLKLGMFAHARNSIVKDHAKE